MSIFQFSRHQTKLQLFIALSMPLEQQRASAIDFTSHGSNLEWLICGMDSW